MEEIEAKGWSLVPSKYIEFKNRDEQIDFDTRMKELQTELTSLLQQEEGQGFADRAVGAKAAHEDELPGHYPKRCERIYEAAGSLVVDGIEVIMMDTLGSTGTVDDYIPTTLLAGEIL